MSEKIVCQEKIHFISLMVQRYIEVNDAHSQLWVVLVEWNDSEPRKVFKGISERNNLKFLYFLDKQKRDEKKNLQFV